MFCSLLLGCAIQAPSDWLRSAAVPLPAEGALPAAVGTALNGVRVLGLGEATHGQHESFELKRRLTMHLVRERGFRLVAYEASSARALACDEYVSGRSSDLAAAMKGFGMLIWQVEENAALLQDLRAWNAAAAPADRVHFVGVDVQDAEAAAARLHALLLPAEPELAARAQPLGTRMEAARDALYTGQAAEFDALWAEVEALRADLQQSHAARAQAGSPTAAEEVLQRGLELTRFMSAARTPGGRDRAMAETLLEALERAGPDSRAVIWAHNAHVTAGALRHEGLAEPAMGGVLRTALGQAYYAAGFLFGEGSFNALARDAERGWIFRSTTLSPAPAGSLEAPFFAARLGTSFLDLRAAPRSGALSDWLDAAHGQRWFGGANIPEDADAQTQDSARLLQTVPRQDFDGLIYLPVTSPSRPH